MTNEEMRKMEMEEEIDQSIEEFSMGFEKLLEEGKELFMNGLEFIKQEINRKIDEKIDERINKKMNEVN